MAKLPLDMPIWRLPSFSVEQPPTTFLDTTMKRLDEEIARTEFEKLLINEFGVPELIWQEVRQEDEPPDYFLRVRDRKYAVEVTSIHDFTRLGDRRFPSLSIASSLTRLVKEVESEARFHGYLSGTYAVGLSPLTDFPDRRDHVKLTLLDYISRTKDFQRAPEEAILDQGFEQIRIQKLHDKSDRVAEIITFSPKWEGESVLELESALESALRVKMQKLTPVSEPIILLILDAFNFLDEDKWHEAIIGAEQTSFYHTICLISLSGKSSILWPYDGHWIN